MSSVAKVYVDQFESFVEGLEQTRGSRIYCVIQTRGDHICGPTFNSILKARKGLKDGEKLELLIHSPGGHPDIAYQAVKFFRRRFKSVNAIVPMMAKSAATLMCLGTDTIYMGELAELGPLDVQLNDPVKKGETPISPIDDFKSMEFLREHAVEILDYFTLTIIERSGVSLKEALHESMPATIGIVRSLYEKIDPLEIGGHRRALAIGEEYATRLLKLVNNPNYQTIAERLVWNYPAHNFVLDFEECRELGLPVELLDRSLDQQLTDALNELLKHGITYHGFATKPDANRVAPPKSAKAQTRRLQTRPNGREAVTSEQ